MKLLPAEDNIEEMLTNRLVSEKGLVEVGVYRVLYGFRVRAGFVGEMGATLDWCAGGEWLNVERLYSLCVAILSTREENRSCFDGLPRFSSIKPFFNDEEFVRIIGELAGDFQFLHLKPPTLKPNWLDFLLNS